MNDAAHGPRLPQRTVVPLLLAAAGYLLYALAMQPGLFTHGLYWDERFSEYLAWRVEAGRQLAAGHFPFFTPLAFGGMPLFSTSYIGVLYPPNWIYITGSPYWENLLSVLHLVAGGMGMFVYLRGRRLLGTAAFFGGLLYIANSFMLSHGAHISMREAALVAPWVVWLGRRVIVRPGPARAAQLACALALQFAIGYQQIVLFTVLWIGVDWIEQMTRRRPGGLRSTLWLAAGGLAGAALAGIQIFPALAHAAQTPRGGLTMDSWQADSLLPDNLLILFSPMAFGHGRTWFGGNFAAEQHATIPACGWALAAAGVVWAVFSARFRLRRGRTILVYTSFAFLALLLAFGKHFAPSSLLFHIPPFNLFRVPARWLFLFNVFGIVVASIATQSLLRKSMGTRLAVFAVCFVLWAECCIEATYYLGTMEPAGAVTQLAFSRIPTDAHMAYFLGSIGWPAIAALDYPYIHPLLTFAAGIMLVVLGRRPRLAALAVLPPIAAQGFIMLVIGSGIPGPLDAVLKYDRLPLISSVPRKDIVRVYTLTPAGAEVVEQALPQGSNLYVNVPTLGGYTPLMPERVFKVLGIDQGGITVDAGRYLRDTSALKQLAVSHLYAAVDDEEPWDRAAYLSARGHLYTPLAWKPGLEFLKLENTRPRFDWADNWQGDYTGVNLDDYILHADPSVPGTPTIAEKPERERMPPEYEPIPPADSIEVLTDDPSYQKVRVQSPKGGLLVIRDVFWKGWSYRVPGVWDEWKSMRQANGIVRYVPVPPGDATIEMRFIPPGWQTGVGFSLGGLAAVIGMIAMAVVGRRRRRARA